MSEATVAKVSGSKLILTALKAKGINAPAKDIQAAVKEMGGEVSVALINNIKFKVRQNKAEKKGERQGRKRRATLPVPGTVAAAAPTNEYEQMLAVKTLAAGVGGYDNLNELINKVRALAG